ncbi:Diaminopimelate epimerase-like protein [Hypoxylon fragiforme]|uniref:Diaminopimelate epimerase-like protein n=1 Tax=Hypoxylon fragiforme TaxID=63214 RepID=UPI0020C69783|nr:Diaminopimelate epimerase-like protein [Hypoxylon fragiforme]KAI2614105.1 Diaminopimelate epimerase-like protein [Hypoxylon fragiforme]
MELQYTTLDVFTSHRLQGNPLAVVTVPAALRSKLPQATKQKIAREFNLSETVFLHEPDKQGGSRDIDIFTVDREIPFAGHPTIGTAVLLKYYSSQTQQHVDLDTLITKAGPIPVFSADGNRIRAKIPHNVHLHARTLGDLITSVSVSVSGFASASSLPGLTPAPQIRAAELAAPVLSIVNGMTFILVRLASLALLAQVSTAHRLDLEGLPAPLLDEGWRGGLVSRYYYVDVGDDEGKGEGEGGEERSVRTRLVDAGCEDPATGSAASALAAYLSLYEERKGTRLRVTQGVEMGRESHIDVETTVRETSDGGREVVDLWLEGTAVVVMRGSLAVDV